MKEDTMVEADDTNIADNANSAEEPGEETSELVEVTFKKNPFQREKYLEAEPKVLGMTQIMLGLFLISSQALVDFYGHYSLIHTLVVIFCLIVIIAGSLAVAAQNLHLPTMKACLGMQIVTCSASVMFVCTINVFLQPHVRMCRPLQQYTVEIHNKMCDALNNMYSHYVAVEVLMGAALIALSATLAAFCCKVIKCCSPPPSMPVITINSSQLLVSD